jgi:hypothetical protein
VQTQGIEAIVRDITEHRRLEIMKINPESMLNAGWNLVDVHQQGARKKQTPPNPARLKLRKLRKTAQDVVLGSSSRKSPHNLGSVSPC